MMDEIGTEIQEENMFRDKSLQLQPSHVMK